MQVRIRPLEERDFERADHVLRLAFGTFLGLPDPLQMFGDTDHVRTKWRADPQAALAAESDGVLVGSNFVTNWGSVGYFGPLSVHPELWDKGVAQRLLEPTIELFSKWGNRHMGLFTFPHSAKHVALYQKFGFWPRFLTAVMSKPVGSTSGTPRFSRYSEVPAAEKESVLSACRETTDSIYEGLDVQREIRAVDAQRLGDTVLLWEGSRVEGFAVCHVGPGTEAGSGTCYMKFGAARPGPGAADAFERLLDACEAFAASCGMSQLGAGMNLAREEAYRKLRARGFRTEIQGVAMHNPNEAGYNRPGVFLIDDWH